MGSVPKAKGAGDVRQTLLDLLRRVSTLERTSGLDNASIGEGGLTIEDGGDIELRGGSFRQYADDGTLLAQFGDLPEETYPGEDGAWVFVSDSETFDNDHFGVLIIRPSDTYPDGFTALEWVGDNAFLKYDNDHWYLLDQSGHTFTGDATFRADVFMDNYPTTGSAANMHMNTNGRFFRVSSSRRYKGEIRDLEVNVPDLLRLKPRTFRSLAEADKGAPRMVGFIAEEAEELGLSAWVEKNEGGECESFAYPSWVVALQAICQDQQQQIDTLRAEVAALRGTVETNHGGTT